MAVDSADFKGLLTQMLDCGRQNGNHPHAEQMPNKGGESVPGVPLYLPMEG